MRKTGNGLAAWGLMCILSCGLCGCGSEEVAVDPAAQDAANIEKEYAEIPDYGKTAETAGDPAEQ